MPQDVYYRSLLDGAAKDRYIALRKISWEVLFKGCDLAAIAAIVNSVWLDPHFCLLVRSGERIFEPLQFVRANCRQSKGAKNTRYFDRHHRQPKSRGGSDASFNISLVPRHKHAAWHRLFNAFSPQKIIEEFNIVWLPIFGYKDRFELRKISENPRNFKDHNFVCGICGERYDNLSGLIKCQKRGYPAPRYFRGELVRVVIKGNEPWIGTVDDFIEDDFSNPHENEVYSVSRQDGKTEIVFARNIFGFVGKRGKIIKKKERRVRSPRQFRKCKKACGF